MKLPNTPLAIRLKDLITRWTKIPKPEGSGFYYRYYSRCIVTGCNREISLQKFQSRQEGNLQCRTCSKIRGYIHNVPIRSARVWALRKRILEFRTVDGRLQPFIKCAKRGCKEAVLLRHNKYHAKGKPSSGRCNSHRRDGRSMSPYVSHYKLLKTQAQKRFLPCSLSFASFVALFTANACHYCESQTFRGPYKFKITQALGIDRKNPSLGYSKNNCVPCCPSCNFTKNAFVTYEEMLVIGAMRSQNAKKAQNAMMEIDLRKNVANYQKLQLRLSASIKAAWALRLAKKDKLST